MEEIRDNRYVNYQSIGITRKCSELEIRSDIIPQLVFHKQVLPPGANVIKLLFTVILL
jgi:hypothetical protein